MSTVITSSFMRWTKNPIRVGEVRAFGLRFIHGAGGFVHSGDIVKEIETLTNSMFGTDIRVIHIGGVDFLRELEVGEPSGLVLKVEHLEEHRFGPIVTISFLARRIHDGKHIFSGSYRIRLL